MAVAKFKCRIFATPFELETFVKNDASVASVVSIVTDNAGKLVLFYLTP